MTAAEVTPRALVGDAAVDQLERAGFAVAARVWVATLELGDGAGWISVHTTAEGAAAALVRFARESGIQIPPYDVKTGCDVLDNHPEVQSYGVSHVPVQR